MSEKFGQIGIDRGNNHIDTHMHTHTHTEVGICYTYRYGSLFSNAVIKYHVIMMLM